MFNLRVFTFSLICFSLHSIGAEKLKVSIYYESLCPHSQAFITRQLHPGYLKIGEYLEVDFVPYGKATHTLVNGEWLFKCQHGSLECYGNKLQACALDQNKEQDKSVEFVNCVMGSRNPSSDADVEECANKHNFSWSEIKNCVGSARGSEILVHYGDRTHGVVPKITYVPTIIFNAVYNGDLQSQAERGFLKTACDLLEEEPDACNE